ncbi:hypothetical protein [Streptomyces axinellae]|uniref:Uncharacterized protein n=1 Tax=Streptomyces axinellae TaxID=552788 RepID=A0ABN3R0T2_9ACTN
MTNAPDASPAGSLPAPQDYDRLLNLKALTHWTFDIQNGYADDSRTFEAALAAFQAHLRSQHVAGDGKLSAPRRARKIERRLKALSRAARRAEREAVGLRTDYAAHVAHVAALPGQREARAAKKVGRRAAAGELAAKSLNKTATTAAAAATAPGDTSAPQEAPAGQVGQMRGINELWSKGRSA